MWKRVIAPTLLVTLLWVGVSGTTTIYINRLFESHETILSEDVASIEAAASMEDVLWRIQADVLEAAETGRSGPRSEITRLEASFDRHLADAERTAVTVKEQTLVKTIREQALLYREKVHQRLKLKGTARSSTSVSVGETLSLARAVAQPCKQLLQVNEQLMRESNARNARLATSVRFFRMFFLVAGPLVGILFGILAARGLHRSVSQISIILKDATGDLDHEVGHVELSPASDLPELQQRVALVSTRIRQVVGQLQAARREVIRAERLAAIGGLAAGIAHELRNPLTSVKLMIQNAVRRYPDRPLSVAKLELIQREVSRMENVIQSLLDFARPATLNRVPHDLRETLQRAVNLVEGRAEHGRVRIVQVCPDASVTVDGDPDQLHQVFVNLLLNGIESMADGGVLSVAIESDAAARRCRVLFSDSGCGISAEVLERLFEPFVTDKERGTGLGLAISQRIIQEHGGAISAANQEAGGARFVVELMLLSGDSAPAGEEGTLPSGETRVPVPTP